MLTKEARAVLMQLLRHPLQFVLEVVVAADAEVIADATAVGGHRPWVGLDNFLHRRCVHDLYFVVDVCYALLYEDDCDDGEQNGNDSILFHIFYIAGLQNRRESDSISMVTVVIISGCAGLQHGSFF